MARSKKSRGKPDVGELLNRFAQQEEEFLQREFLAPALPGGTVRVRLGGVICKMRIEPADFRGWGLFQPISHKNARLQREATLAERRSYLQILPQIRLIVCRRVGDSWYGSAASFGDSRIRLAGLAPINLAEEVQLFDCVRTRYDGSQFWFDEADMRHDPSRSAYLRSQLGEQTAPEGLDRSGLTAEERAAYELNYWELSQPPGDARDLADLAEADPIQHRLRESLSHAGAQLIDYLERADSFRVTYSVGGRQYTSSVNKEDLTVQVAGICLSGEDQKFDLGSLVGVLREGDQHGDILNIGDEQGLNEEEYWRVHPPRG